MYRSISKQALEMEFCCYTDDTVTMNRFEASRFEAPADYPPRSVWQSECVACGACCSAPDISALNKPLGVPCVHLQTDCLCLIYPDRPATCRNYQPDWVCGEVAPLPTLEKRIHRFLEIYDLQIEAAHQIR